MNKQNRTHVDIFYLQAGEWVLAHEYEPITTWPRLVEKIERTGQLARVTTAGKIKMHAGGTTAFGTPRWRFQEAPREEIYQTKGN